MKRIIIKFEYKCFPLWLYENDIFVDNIFPEILDDNEKLEKMFDELQEMFDSLYIDNDIEFSYVGFADELQKELFVKKVCEAVDELKVKLNNDYVVDFSKEKLITNL
ncbi:hypothetical protein SAMN02910289_01266 [Lachnospiraceae bacterium RM5]|nr:hypothetical protein SAMN02910289_01266 [Lachnospiraceae bacterium RM5]